VICHSPLTRRDAFCCVNNFSQREMLFVVSITPGQGEMISFMAADPHGGVKATQQAGQITGQTRRLA
jgi:hypothetical protein